MQADRSLCCSHMVRRHISVSILPKSIAVRYRSVRVADGPITVRYRFIKNASWDFHMTQKLYFLNKKLRIGELRTENTAYLRMLSFMIQYGNLDYPDQTVHMRWTYLKVYVKHQMKSECSPPPNPPTPQKREFDISIHIVEKKNALSSFIFSMRENEKYFKISSIWNQRTAF